eukprot:gene11299-12606_t
MDPIEFYIKNNRKFSPSLLLNAQARLCVLQLGQGYVTYEDVVKSLSLSANQPSPTPDIVAHAALMYEAALAPSVTKKGLIAHKLHQDTGIWK